MLLVERHHTGFPLSVRRACVDQGRQTTQALRSGGPETCGARGIWPKSASRVCGTRLAPVLGMARSSRYEPRSPADGVVYQVVRDHYETFRAQAERASDGGGLPRFVREEFEGFLRCGFLAGGFARFHCESCDLDRLVPFSCCPELETMTSSGLGRTPSRSLPREALQIVSVPRATR